MRLVKVSLEDRPSSMTPNSTEEVDLTELEGKDSTTPSSAEWANSMKHSSTEEARRTFREGLLPINFNVELTVQVEVAGLWTIQTKEAMFNHLHWIILIPVIPNLALPAILTTIAATAQTACFSMPLGARIMATKISSRTSNKAEILAGQVWATTKALTSRCTKQTHLNRSCTKLDPKSKPSISTTPTSSLPSSMHFWTANTSTGSSCACLNWQTSKLELSSKKKATNTVSTSPSRVFARPSEIVASRASTI